MNTFSHSRIGAYDACPKKYELSYIRNVEMPGEGIEAFTGKRVHEALEFLYRHVRMARVPGIAEVAACYQKKWDEHWHGDVKVARAGFAPEQYRDVGERQLRDYYVRHHPFHGGAVVGLEQKVEFSLDGEGAYPMVGYIDRLMKVKDGVWEIHDYKTSTTLPSREEIDADTQLPLYQLGISKMFDGVEEVALVFHYLFFDEELRTHRTWEQIHDLGRRTIEKIDRIASAREFPAKQSALCDWCEFQAICPAWGYEEELKSLPREQLGRERGVALADRYMATVEELARLEREKGRLEREMLAFANEKGIGALVGSSGRLTVWRYRQYEVPDYKDPRRREFERLVRAAGLWETVSSFSSYQFSKAVEEGKISRDAMAALEPYLTRVDGARFYPKR